jgi:hypothetical protein
MTRGDNNKTGTAAGEVSQQSREALPINDKQQNKATNRKRYNLLVDDVPYEITAEPFTFNGEVRYYISVNGTEEHVFTWDSEMKRLKAIDDEAATLPDALEQQISHRLQASL